MSGIDAGNRVQIINLRPGDDTALLNRTGRVMMIVDGEECLVMLDGGGETIINIKHLKRL